MRRPSLDPKSERACANVVVTELSYERNDGRTQKLGKVTAKDIADAQIAHDRIRPCEIQRTIHYTGPNLPSPRER